MKGMQMWVLIGGTQSHRKSRLIVVGGQRLVQPETHRTSVPDTVHTPSSLATALDAETLADTEPGTVVPYGVDNPVGDTAGNEVTRTTVDAVTDRTSHTDPEVADAPVLAKSNQHMRTVHPVCVPLPAPLVETVAVVDVAGADARPAY